MEQTLKEAVRRELAELFTSVGSQPVQLVDFRQPWRMTEQKRIDGEMMDKSEIGDLVVRYVDGKREVACTVRKIEDAIRLLNEIMNRIDEYDTDYSRRPNLRDKCKVFDGSRLGDHIARWPIIMEERSGNAKSISDMGYPEIVRGKVSS